MFLGYECFEIVHLACPQFETLTTEKVLAFGHAQSDLAYSDGNIVRPLDDPNMVSLGFVSSCAVGLNSCPFLLNAIFVDPVDSAIHWVVVDEGDLSRALTCTTASKVVDVVGRHASVATVRIMGIHA